MPPGTLLPPAHGPGEAAPFADRGRLGFVGAFGQTWRLVAFEPRRFFRFVRVDQVRAALLFGVICATLGAWAQLAYAAAFRGPGAGALEQLIRRMPEGSVDPEVLSQLTQQATARDLLMQALVTPVAALAGIYVIAGIFHLLLIAVRGAGRGFGATVSVVAYAFGTLLLEALPACGALVAIGWFAVVAVVGLGEAQRCGGGRAAFAVLAPLVLAFACSCAVGVLLGAHVVGGGGVDLPQGGTGL